MNIIKSIRVLVIIISVPLENVIELVIIFRFFSFWKTYQPLIRNHLAVIIKSLLLNKNPVYDFVMTMIQSQR